MRFGSVCSGIEAASVAWHPIGWEAAWLCEIEPFPCAVLAHHYPSVPNYGDMMALPERIRSGEVEAPDLFCGGTPCQAFSVAGNRRSLDDARGNLSLTFCEIADAIDHARTTRGEEPAIIFWENVPGVQNTKDNAFGCFLAGLAGEDVALEPPGGKWTDAGFVSGPARNVAWRVLDAQYFGLAQRRKRVFVVASAREGFNPAAVLFEFNGVQRHTPPSREARQGTAADAQAGVGTRGHRMMAFGEYADDETASTMKMRDYKDATDLVCAEISPTVTNDPPFSRTGNERVECDALVVSQFGEVAGTLTARHDSSPCADRGMNVVTYGIPGNWIGRAPENGGNATTPMDNVAPCLTGADRHGVGDDGDPQLTLQAAHCHAVAYDMKQRHNPQLTDTLSLTTKNCSMVRGDTPLIQTQYAVRRLTPTECERLQGFPDGYTNIPWRNKPETPDGPRYKALGNSWAVPVVRWVGRRIEAAL